MDFGGDLDPDINFFSSMDTTCCCHTNEQFNHRFMSEGKLSIIHFNSRSLYANFNHIRDYLRTFAQPFSVIAVSETWLDTDREMDILLSSYEFSYTNRKNKSEEE